MEKHSSGTEGFLEQRKNRVDAGQTPDSPRESCCPPPRGNEVSVQISERMEGTNRLN